MKTLQVLFYDTFTSVPLLGNPAAIFPNARGLSEDQMQAVAREINLSETAFVFPSSRADFFIRFFTPKRELPFAGHPIIAAVFALADQGLLGLEEPVTQIRLECTAGIIPVELHLRDRRPIRVTMTQQTPSFGPSVPIQELTRLFSLKNTDFRHDCYPQVVDTGVPFLIAATRDLQVLRELNPDHDILAELCKGKKVSAVFTFCIGGFNKKADTHARLFDPTSDSEDFYTGSAAGAMGAYVLRHGLRPGPRLLAEQGHLLGRPGEGRIEVLGTREDIKAVSVSGEAIKVLDGSFYLPGN